MTPDNAWKVIEAGANAIVAGSAVFKAPSYRDGKHAAATRHARLQSIRALGSGSLTGQHIVHGVCLCSFLALSAVAFAAP